jgi:hypothetical protein
MASLYKNRADRVQDVILAYAKPENSVRYSLTHGGRYLPFEQHELESMRQQRAWAMARLVIDKVMRLPPLDLNRFRSKQL